MSDPAPSPSPSDRTAALISFDLLSPIKDSHLDRICALVAAQCGVETAFIGLIDNDHQGFLGKSGSKLPTADQIAPLCRLAAKSGDVTVIADAAGLANFRNAASEATQSPIAFYAGTALITADGIPLGALCILDIVPRENVSDIQKAMLRLMADAVMDHLSLRRARRNETLAARDAAIALDASEWRFRTLADTMPQMVWSTRADGYSDYFNARWYEFTGMPAGASEGRGWLESLHLDDHESTGRAWRHSIDSGEPYEVEYRIKRHDGQYRWSLARGLAMRDDDGTIMRWFGTCTDIHDHKIALEERELISQELSHRIKNIFAVISGLIGLSVRDTPAVQSFSEALRDRVLALGRAHAFVGPLGYSEGDAEPQHSLHGLLQEIFAPYEAETGGRIDIRGNDVVIDDRSATPLALTFHEIVTNAAKYGALSLEGGHASLSIRHQDSSVVMTWEERNGPRIGAINKAGFGSRLLDLSVRRQLGGHYQQYWEPEGLTMRISIPATSFSRRSG